METPRAVSCMYESHMALKRCQIRTGSSRRDPYIQSERLGEVSLGVEAVAGREHLRRRSLRNQGGDDVEETLIGTILGGLAD